MSLIEQDNFLLSHLKRQSIDDILYRIGLSPESDYKNPKRKLLYNPLVIFIFTLMHFLFFEIMPIFINDEVLLKILGLPGNFYGL